jgi:hypothetical protein
VAGDEDVILRRDQVRLDEIGAQLDRQLIGRERVLGPVAAGATMGDHDGMENR